MLIFDLLNRALERMASEADRARKVVPTVIRFGISELEDLYHRFNHWRGVCDHTEEQLRRRKVDGRKKTSKPQRIKKKR